MKIIVSLLLLSLPFGLLAKNTAEYSAKRTGYYNAGMAASIRYFDAAMKEIIDKRLQKKFTEEEFLAAHNTCSTQYYKQQQRLSVLAAKWSGDQEEKPSKSMKSALASVIKANIPAAITIMDKRLSGFENDAEMRTELMFRAELLQLSGNLGAAVKSYETLASSKIATAEDQLFFAGLLSAKSQFQEAIKWNKKGQELLKNDTLALIKAKLDAAQIQMEDENPHAASAILIEVQFLLEHYTLNSKEEQQFLFVKTIKTLAKEQLELKNFDNALPNINKAIGILKSAEQSENFDWLPLNAEAYQIQASVYRLAGENRIADSIYKIAMPFYENLAKDYPERYEPVLIGIWREYSEVQKWFDKYDALEQNYRKIIDAYSKLMTNEFPFFRLQYALTEGILAQKKMDVDVKVFLAEAEWIKSKDVLVSLNNTFPVIAGDHLCRVLYKLGVIKITLRKQDEAAPIFAQSLAVRENMFKLAPMANKSELATLLFQNATLNYNPLKKIELAMEQLSRAKTLADEAGDTRFSLEIEKFKNGILRN